MDKKHPAEIFAVALFSIVVFGAALNPPNSATFYGVDKRDDTDYPKL